MSASHQTMVAAAPPGCARHYRARCSCGWVSRYYRTYRRAGAAAAHHVLETRRPVAVSIDSDPGG
jgi:hypothetical protein